MFNTVIAWARAHRNIFIWLGIGLALIICWSIWSNMISTPTAQPTTVTTQPPAPAAGWHFLKLAFLVLIGAAYASRATRKSYYFGGMAILLLFVLIGKFDSLFSWTTIGLPAFAAIGIWGMTQIDATTNGRMKSFLGFSSGVVILWWMYLFYIAHPIEEIEYINGVFCSDNTARVALVVFIGTTIFATWKRSKFFYGVAIVAFLVFLGNDKINDMSNRFPEKFTPSVSQKTKNTWEKFWENKVLGTIDDLSNPKTSTTQTQTPTSALQPTQAPASTPAPTPTPASQPVPTTKSVAPQGVAQPSVTYKAYVPKDGYNTLQVPEGTWEVSSPPGALVRRANSSIKEQIINQQYPGEVYVYPPPGTSANVVLTKIN